MQTLQLLLTDAPLATLHQRVPKYQIFRYDQVVDFSSWAQLGYNVQAQLGRFKKETLVYHQDFISHASFKYEYRFVRNLTHAQCLSTCYSRKSRFPSRKIHLDEINDFHPPLNDFFWVDTNQTVEYDDYLDKYHYELHFDAVQVFPSNTMIQGTTLLYHFLKGEYVLMYSHQLRSRASYYDFTAQQYYRKEPYTLRARYKANSTFHVFIPMDSTSFEPDFAKSTCVCQRQLTENTKNAARAKDISDTVRSSLYDTPVTLESVRVKRDKSQSDVSNVVSILQERPDPFQSTPDKWFLYSDDIFPLLITDPLQAQNESLPVSRRKRAASIFLSALAKTLFSHAAAISSPYILQESKNIFRSLMDKTSLTFSANRFNRTQASNASFQDFLDDHFSSSPSDATLLHDRLRLSVKNVPKAVYSMYSPDVTHAEAIRRTARKLEIFRDQVLTSLPELLLERVLHSIPHRVRKDSEIVVHVKKSLSFYVFTYYVECTVDTYSFTNITAFPMPYVQEGKDFYAAFIQDDILSIDFDSSHSLKTQQSEECAQVALSNVPSNLFPSCKRVLYVPKLLSQAFDLFHGQIVLILGPGVLQISCFQKASQVVTLADQFNLFYINYACGYNIKHENLNRFVRGKTKTLVGMDFLYLLGYNVPSAYSTTTKYFHWLIIISVGVAVVITALCSLIIILAYCKRRYQPQLTLTQDGAIECSLVNCEDSLNASQQLTGKNPFVPEETDTTLSKCEELPSKQLKPTKPAAH